MKMVSSQIRTIFATFWMLKFVQCHQDGNEIQPNIVFILADDLGWNDVSWHDSQMHTPNLHRLAHHHAVILNQSYVNKVCSPTRSAMLTGYYPFHIGTQHSYFKPMEPSGVPISFRFYPDRLRDLGYSTYMVGKWHLGYCNESFLPTSRGFERFFGFYTGSEHYFTHLRGYTPITGHTVVGYDFWNQSSPAFESKGHYSTEVFANQTELFLQNHNASKPFFLYYAFQAVHSPLEVPKRYQRPCKQARRARNVYCGMVNAMDIAIGRLIENLKQLGFYDNTFIVFGTDNGGQNLEGGNNFPLRGNKGTLWEGGTRGVYFVHSKRYFPADTMTQRTSLFHVVDWYSTLLTLAGNHTDTYGDGFNQLDLLLHNDSFGRRRNFVYNIDKLGAAYRRGRFKLIVGDPGKPGGWIPPERRANRSPHHRSRSRKRIYLFDLQADPTEHYNLASRRPELVRRLLRELRALEQTAVPSIHRPPDPRGDPQHFNGTFASGWCTTPIV